MRQIWKKQLAITDNQIIGLPKDSSILSLQMQRGILCLWALVDPDKLEEERYIRIIGTGHPIDDKEILYYIGTVQMAEDNLVWHVFETEKK